METGLDVGISRFYLSSIRLVELFQGQIGQLLFVMKGQLIVGSASHLCLPLVPNLGGLNAFFLLLGCLVNPSLITCSL